MTHPPYIPLQAIRTDSSLPYLLLPDTICEMFEEHFELRYDHTSNLYTLNESAHQKNQQHKAIVSFRIGYGEPDSNYYTKIVLPYDAFHPNICLPDSENLTRYFPLKRSSDGSFKLGGTFLQEAVIVDYERSNFTVAPAIYTDPMPDEDLVPIYNTKYTPPISILARRASRGDERVFDGAIAGITTGLIAFIVGAALGLCLWRIRNHRQQIPLHYEEAIEVDNSATGNEAKRYRISELDTLVPGSPKVPDGDCKTRSLRPFPSLRETEVPPQELYTPSN
ncbi:hypothetical protein P171DRAFT_446778 [Karstenula rhodostoma CBS 690.94]|uniref:Peptidase A1 domain-containing protein n=1 Tax=Karstenula rhodostoma CBS 690.94 TaxID=1392251 RepID=A0A9P4P9D8_9PLEO|nr:hypothetical protein P171DRAFT_446778 [Karstenula rhodostoma CBS 690.94]